MAGEWSTGTLGEIADLVMGQSPTGDTCNEVGRGVPLLNGPTEFGGNHPRPVQFTTDPRKFAEPGDLLFCVRGSTTGRMNWADQRYAIGRGLAAIRAKKGTEYRHFVRAVIDANLPRLLASATGSTFPNVSRNQIQEIECALPPLAEQKAIAAVLGALDDKIELNRRMNATLEAMARALFQSWFVDFDPVRAKLDGRPPAALDPTTAALFPEHFDHKVEGVIPTGWRATTLGEVIEISDSKRIPLSGREREARQGKYPYHGAASVMDYVDDFLFDGIYALMGEDGSVINEDGTPVLQYVWGKFWVNNHAHVLRGKNGISTEHVLLHLKGSIIAPFVNGAVQPKLNQGNMNRIPFMIPAPEIGQAFSKAIDPLFAQIRANTEQSRTLATLRDTLLPKLLSGELSVGDEERQIERATSWKPQLTPPTS